MNMKTLLRLAPLVVALAALPARAETKIGFVEIQRALREVDEGKAATAVLKRDFDEKQKQLDFRKTEFEKLKGDFEKQASIMTDEVKKSKGAELDRKAMELQQLFVQLQKDLSVREQETMRGIVDKMNGVVREVADANGISLVLNDAAIVWVQPSLDLTNELIRRYNARYPAGKAAPKPPKADGSKPASPAPAAKK
jgi:outer membrane protein